MLRAYEGDESYVFVSYAHADDAVVMPILEELQRADFRVWYDAGIQLGTEFPTYIAEHVDKCMCMLAFISRASVESRFCRREVFRADKQGKTILTVYLEDVKLDPGTELLLDPTQAIYRRNFASDEAFNEELVWAPILEPCLTAEGAGWRKAVRSAEKTLASHPAGIEDLELAAETLQSLPHRDGRATRALSKLETCIKQEKASQRALEAARRQHEIEERQKRETEKIVTEPPTPAEGEIGAAPEHDNVQGIQESAAKGGGMQTEMPLTHLLRRRWPIAAAVLLVAIAILAAWSFIIAPKPGALTSDTIAKVDDYEAAANQFSFGSKLKRSEVSSITFSSSMPDGLDEEGWDVSEAKDRSVLARYTKNSGGYYDLLIAANGDVYAPKDCSYLFAGYDNVRVIDFGTAFKTQGVQNARGMFYGCSSLERVNVSDFDTGDVSDLSYMFDGCSKLTDLNVSGFDTSSATRMVCMFHRCSSLTSLEVDHFDTSKVEGMRMMFSFCSALEELNVSGFDTSSATDTAGMFEDCSSLKSLNVTGFDTSKSKYTNHMFKNCSTLKLLDVSGFDTSNVTDMRQMFQGCSQLKKIKVDHFDTSKVTNMNSMFDGCSSVTSLEVSSFDTSNVTDMHRMFNDCSQLTELNVSEFYTSMVTDMGRMFCGCSSLGGLAVSGFDTSKVTDMHGMFYGCSSLRGLDVSGFDTSKATNMHGMFYKCSSLRGLDVSGFKTSGVTDMSWTFGECTGITPLNLAKWDVSHSEKFEGMFSGATGDLEVRYPKDDEAWEQLVARYDLEGTPTFVAV